MKNKFTRVHGMAFIAMVSLGAALSILLASCGISAQYSMTGSTTDAETISITEFYNNADLGPANMSQVFTNALKNYFVQNSSICVVGEEGQLQLEGEISDLRLTPIAPTATNDPTEINRASATRLTITVKATYINTLNDKMSFKDKTFSFYKDFDNELNISDVQDSFIKEIFDRIVNDIFNASVANW
ncbi:MAG TPA: LptE family protein [Chryseosolibacter sp.]|nr:LptE family protein [Chryseosolibacter sp.]